MLPDVFPLLNVAPVRALVGTNPVRVYRHGSAPQNVVAPYVTWFLVTGNPENALDELPRVDRQEVQIDCWSNNDGQGAKDVETLAQAVRDAMEARYHMTAIIADGRDPDTDRYRVGMTFTIWNHR